MNCQRAREVLSADLDGEPPPGSPAGARAHVETCVGCGSWLEAAHSMTRAVRVGSPLPAADLGTRILDAVAKDVRQRRERRYWLTVFIAVALAGAVQLLATVPLLMLMRSHPSGHGGHLLGLVEAVLGASFFLGALVVLWKTREQSLLELVRLDSRRPARRATASEREVA